MSCEANLPRRACRRRRRTVGPRGARRSRHDRWAGGDSWLFRERCRIGPRFCLYPGRGQSWPAGPAGRLSATAAAGPIASIGGGPGPEAGPWTRDSEGPSPTRRSSEPEPGCGLCVQVQRLSDPDSARSPGRTGTGSWLTRSASDCRSSGHAGGPIQQQTPPLGPAAAEDSGASNFIEP